MQYSVRMVEFSEGSLVNANALTTGPGTTVVGQGIN